MSIFACLRSKPDTCRYVCVCSNESVAQSADPFEINKSINYHSFTGCHPRTYLNSLFLPAIRDPLYQSFSTRSCFRTTKTEEKKNTESTAAGYRSQGEKTIVVNERSLFVLHRLQLQLRIKSMSNIYYISWKYSKQRIEEKEVAVCVCFVIPNKDGMRR